MIGFDPLRAQRETVAGFVDVLKVVSSRRCDAERRLAEAEIDHTVLLKIEQFVRAQCDEARERLQELEAAEQKS